MEISIHTIVRKKFHSGFTRKFGDVNEVVIHGTGGGGTLEWVRSGGRADQYYRGVALFHYLIERDGKITEVIDHERWVYHSSTGKHDRHTIGIELVNTSPSNASGYTEKQYRSLFWLIFVFLMKRHPISVIVSHKRAMEKASKGRWSKNCPGNFDWRELEKYMMNKGVQFDHDRRYESYWAIKS